MKWFLKRTIIVLLLSSLKLGTSGIVYAAETACNNNGGAGWPITDLNITNILIPFNFGDVSEIFDLNVTTDISHTYIGDLTVKITSPESGTETLLFERAGTAALDTAPVDTGPYGCNLDDIVATFDDEAIPAVTIENICPVVGGTSYLAEDVLSVYDGEDPTGDWGFYFSDSANQDQGTLNEACITASFAAVTFDKWISSNATCTDNIESIAVAPGTDVYFCYTVENPSTEAFVINPGDASDSEGHDLSPLEGITYTVSGTPGDSITTIVGPIVAGSASLPVGTTVNNASVTGTFATVNFTGTLTTPETATAIVGNPILNTSTKTVVDLNGGTIDPGDVLEYTITINETAGIFTPNVQVTDVVDANLGSITITTLPVGSTDNTVGNNIDITGISVPASGSETIVFEATIAGVTPAGTNIDNTATISHAASTVSYDTIAPTIIVSAPVISTSTKVELDVDGSPALAGDLIRYTITINETGGSAATNVTVTDVVDVNLTSVTIISIPVGATDNTVGNTIDISGISVAASGSESIVFEANIVGGASVGTVIDNTAVIVDVPTSVTTSPAAGSIVVGSLPTNGLKNLYLEDAFGGLDTTRIVPTANSDLVDIDFNNSADFDQTPVFQDAFTITGGSTATVFLNLQRLFGGGARTAQVDLFNGNTGTLIGTVSQTWNSNFTQYLTFAIPVAVDENFSVNDFVRIRITNTSANGRQFRVIQFAAGPYSLVEMQSNTVINLDAVAVYSATYPATTQFTSYEPGSTVFIRASISDPFGNADINGADITITDSTPTTLVNNVAMTTVATPSLNTEIFEYQYTIPAGPDGFWDISVTANEGTEGTVSHTSQVMMIVGSTTFQITKDSIVLSDPINVTEPKAIPSSIVEYTIDVVNLGFGYSDSDTFILTDPLAAETTFYFGSPLNPLGFTDGATSSGLTYTFTSLASTLDDIDFSNNGGATYITPSVDASGFDITVPPINYIRINPKGEFNGGNGVNDPSMQIDFRIKFK